MTQEGQVFYPTRFPLEDRRKSDKMGMNTWSPPPLSFLRSLSRRSPAPSRDEDDVLTRMYRERGSNSNSNLNWKQCRHIYGRRKDTYVLRQRKNPVKVQRPVIRLLPPLLSLFRRLDCQQPLPASLSPYFPDVWNGFRQLVRIFQQNVLSMLGSAAQS